MYCLAIDTYSARQQNPFILTFFQMNGAELPCGTTMQVQPSDPLYKLKKKKKMDYYGSAAETTIEEAPLPPPPPPADKKDVVPEDEAKTAPEEDELDDFFASLE
jgi:hypothetical protein